MLPLVAQIVRGGSVAKEATSPNRADVSALESVLRLTKTEQHKFRRFVRTYIAAQLQRSGNKPYRPSNPEEPPTNS